MIILGNQGVVFTDLEGLKKGFAVLAEKQVGIILQMKLKSLSFI